MNRRTPPLTLPPPGATYDQDLLSKWKRFLEDDSKAMKVPGEIVGVNPILLKYPTWGHGLVNGAVWADENGFLKVVRASDVFSPLFTSVGRLGTISVSSV